MLLLIDFVLMDLCGNLTVLNHIHAVGQRCGKAKVLLDEKNRVALGLEVTDDLG